MTNSAESAALDAIRAYAEKQDTLLHRHPMYLGELITGYLNTLIAKGSVEVGYRESCGPTHITLHTHRAWTKVVSRLRKSGFVIREENVKHKNRYATNNGGFWRSIIYTLEGKNERTTK
jgi:hypothetical protein